MKAGKNSAKKVRYYQDGSCNKKNFGNKVRLNMT